VSEPVVDSVTGLAREMRARGASVGMGEVLNGHRALATVDPADPRQARLALRAALCSGRRDLALFDRAWAELVSSNERRTTNDLDPVATAVLPRVAVPNPPPRALDLAGHGELRPAAASQIELLRAKDFGEYSDAERASARAILARVARRGPTRLGRRTHAVARRGSHLDQRATLRAALRHAGEPLDRRWRDPIPTPRRLVLVCDVSGSMEPYARMLLAYAHACVQARKRCEAFAFSTRLTRITRELSGRDPDAALRRAADSAGDWSGGTRIGDAIAALNREHGRRLGRGSVVAILSDGWDRGEPELLEREIERLARCSHRLVWLNPLKATPGYEPLVRGMTAALPHTDLFLAGNTLGSLEQLADCMERGFEARATRRRG
jgi:uncharacterized protein with von Willebrand factor type A (vWA) domain